MSQPSITSFMKKYANILGNDVNKKHGLRDRLMTMIKANREQWQEEAGHVQEHIQYRRAGITADAEAEYIAGDNAAYPEAMLNSGDTYYQGSSTGGGGAYNTKSNVDPPVDTLSFNKDTRGFALLQKAFQTIDMSVEDLRAAAKNTQQLDQVVKVISDTSLEYWTRLTRDEIERVSGHKRICKASGTFDSGTELDCFDATTKNRWQAYNNGQTYTIGSATIDSPNELSNIPAQLSWAHLDSIKEEMLYEGAEEYASVIVDGVPVPFLFTDLKTADRLKTTADSNLRTDIRESSKADVLLDGLGVEFAIRGWIIIPEIWPEKFSITTDSSSGADGTWTDVLPYSSGTNSRTKNSSYFGTTLYSQSYAIMPKAVKCFTPRPNYTGIDPATFGPQDYSGEYEFVCQREKARNTWEAHGYFQGKIAAAHVAEEKELVYTLRSLIPS